MVVVGELEEDIQDLFEVVSSTLMGPIHDAQSHFNSSSNNFWLYTMFYALDEDLGF